MIKSSLWRLSQSGLGKPALLASFLILVTGLSYWSYPGTTLGEEDTQIYLPILIHAQNPSELQKDLIVQHPHTAFTLYDEMVVLFARWLKLDIPAALRIAQFFFRFMLALSFLLISRSLGAPQEIAAAVSALMMLGARVPGAQTLVLEYEPIPRGMALALVFLALAFLSRREFQWGTLLGCLGFLIHPTTTLPFWIGWAVILLSQRSNLQNRHRLILSALPLGTTTLLLGLALRSSLGEQSRYFLSFIDPEWEKWLRLRTPYVFVSSWSLNDLYLLLWAAAILWLAWWRRRTSTPWSLKNFIGATGAWAWVMFLGSWVLLDHLKFAILPQIQPARAVIFVVVFMLVLSWTNALAGLVTNPTKMENHLWFMSSLAFVLDPNLLLIFWPLLALEVLKNSLLKNPKFCGRRHGWRASTLAQLLVAAFVLWIKPFNFDGLSLNSLREMSFLMVVALGFGILFNMCRLRPMVRQFLLLGAIVLLFVLLPKLFHRPAQAPNRSEVQELAAWAKKRTPLEAVFLFADCGRDKLPGVFRYGAHRAVYVDWKGGGQINFSRSFAEEWWRRWEATENMPPPSNMNQAFKDLGIDYVVARKWNFLSGLRLVYQTESFNVYYRPAIHRIGE